MKGDLVKRMELQGPQPGLSVAVPPGVCLKYHWCGMLFYDKGNVFIWYYSTVKTSDTDGYNYW